MSSEQAESLNGDTSPEMKKFIQAYQLASEAASDLISHFKIKAEDVMSDGKTHVCEARDSAMNAVKDKPLISIGVAFAAGWIISKLLK